MSTRETLPNRRATTGYEFEHDGRTYIGHVSLYADGRPAEVFVTGNKVGTGIDTGARATSIGISFALQYGAPMTALRHATQRDPNGRAMDPVGALMDILEAEHGRGRDDQAGS